MYRNIEQSEDQSEEDWRTHYTVYELDKNSTQYNFLSRSQSFQATMSPGFWRRAIGESYPRQLLGKPSSLHFISITSVASKHDQFQYLRNSSIGGIM